MTDYQLSRDALAAMTPQQIVAARDAGRLDAVLGVPADDVAVLDRARTGQALTHEDVRHLSRLGRHDLIVAARDHDRISD